MSYDRGDRDYRNYRGYRDDPRDRGFFERAGDEVRSWFGDDDAERRRRMDERYDDRIDRDRYASTERGGYRPPSAQTGWYRSNRDDFRRGSYGSVSDYPDTRDYEGRQFDDGGRGNGYGRDRLYDNAERTYEYRDYPGGRSDRTSGSYGGTAYGTGNDVGGYGRSASGTGSYGRDEHGYGNWRDRQMNAFDRDYDEYRRENQSRFETEFSSWRQNRQAQRDALSQVKEHQEVVGSDGVHVGTVDHVRADHILLTKDDKDSGGHHHSIPSSWVGTVADKVQLLKSAGEAKRLWREGDQRGGLFGSGQDEQGRDHVEGHGRLNRSFSGTY